MSDKKSSLKLRARHVVPVVLALAAGTAFGISRLRPEEVALGSVVRGTAVDAVYGSGTVEAEDRLDVKAKLPGTVIAIFARAGQHVEKGELLARIDNPLAAADLERARAELDQALSHAGSSAPELAKLRAQRTALEASLTNAEQDLARTEQLANVGAVPRADLDRGRARAAEVRGNVAANEAQMRSLRIDLSANAARQRASVKSTASKVDDGEVRAPMAGTVLVRRIDPGEVVAQNQPLFRIGDTDRLVLEVSVDEGDIGRVRDGSRADAPSSAAITLFATPGQVHRGKVFEILPEANRDRKSFTVRVAFEKPPPSLRSGMSAEVNLIASERADVLLAPAEALDGNALWVVREGRAVRVPVAIGLRDLVRIEVRGDVREGEPVVVAGKEKLRESARVRAKKPVTPAATPAASAIETAGR